MAGLFRKLLPRRFRREGVTIPVDQAAWRDHGRRQPAPPAAQTSRRLRRVLGQGLLRSKGVPAVAISHQLARAVRRCSRG